jgi:hypothetical protein
VRVQPGKIEAVKAVIGPALDPIAVPIAVDDAGCARVDVVACLLSIVEADEHYRQRSLTPPIEIIPIVVVDHVGLERVGRSDRSSHDLDDPFVSNFDTWETHQRQDARITVCECRDVEHLPAKVHKLKILHIEGGEPLNERTERLR